MKPIKVSEASGAVLDWMVAEAKGLAQHRWFWTDHVLTLDVGQTVDTDFRTIRRTA